MGKAMEIFSESCADFPFTSDADHAHIYALALLPYVLTIIDGTTLFHLFKAPIHSSGKILTALTTLRPIQGKVTLVAQTHEEEYRKRVTAEVLSGRPVFFLDKITRPLTRPY